MVAPAFVSWDGGVCSTRIRVVADVGPLVSMKETCLGKCHCVEVVCREIYVGVGGALSEHDRYIGGHRLGFSSCYFMKCHETGRIGKNMTLYTVEYCV